MNKQQAHFEKCIIPYRQKIRQLETENEQLRIDRYNLKSINQNLEDRIDKLQEENKALLDAMNMSEEDRKLMLKRNKLTSDFSTLMNAFSRVY